MPTQGRVCIARLVSLCDAVWACSCYVSYSILADKDCKNIGFVTLSCLSSSLWLIYDYSTAYLYYHHLFKLWVIKKYDYYGS
jgi:hypothetical protein